MAFPPKLLNEREEVVLDLNPHWWFFAGPAFALLLTLAVTAAVAVFDLPDWLWFGVLALTALNLLWLLARLAKWATTNFVVTTDRLIYRSGVMAKKGIEIPLERVNNIHFNQGVFERVLRSGDLLIESGGERGQQAFSNIRRPAFVQNEIYRQIEAAQGRDADRMAGRRELSIPEQIDKLDDLRARGVISQAEFDAKKTQLLDRM
ncbi:MAG TPA: PH domain-containing protein [Acidimicrobiales bacterium]|nr:PH domain-containing protein [Acidimicrobiales bacterium]